MSFHVSLEAPLYLHVYPKMMLALSTIINVFVIYAIVTKSSEIKTYRWFLLNYVVSKNRYYRGIFAGLKFCVRNLYGSTHVPSVALSLRRRLHNWHPLERLQDRFADSDALPNVDHDVPRNICASHVLLEISGVFCFKKIRRYPNWSEQRFVSKNAATAPLLRDSIPFL